MVSLQLKKLGFSVFLAASIVLFMVTGIWFSSIIWLWLVDAGCLAVSILSLITWQIEQAYSGIKLEPEDLIDDDEEAEEDMKRPASPAKTTAPAVKKTAEPAAPKASTATVQKAPAAAKTPSAEPATPKLAVKAESKQPATPKVDEVLPDKASMEAAKLHDAFAAKPKAAPKKQEEQTVAAEEPVAKHVLPSETGKMYKVNKNNVFTTIDAYADAGYTYFSFSKIRKELGVKKNRSLLKLKKLLVEDAILNGLVEKKGRKYYIQKAE
nr:hypothetical protein [Candidatus Sigynarchaeota archaeon]